MVNLTLNIGMDVSMIFGVGEALRGTELLGKGALELGTHLAEECGAGLSFTFATLVSTAHGAMAIGSLHTGEQVWAYNPKTHKTGLEPIVKVWLNHDNDLVDLTITSRHPDQQGKNAPTKSEIVHTTKKHPFLTIERGFLPVAHVKVGMHIQQADGHVGVITKWVSVPGARTMYNLEVANDHTFVVGQGQWVVHNCGNIAKVGDLLEHQFEHEGETYRVLSEVKNISEDGKTIGLHSIMYADTGDLPNSLGVRGILDKVARPIGAQLRAMGFERLDLEFIRAAGSSSANPGHMFQGVFNLLSNRFK